MESVAHRSIERTAGYSGAHPNEFDRHRIERALRNRVRYRYVTPTVEAVADGYTVVSPCCSRNIDPEGGTIDIARLEFHDGVGEWNLFAKDHQRGLWVFRAASTRLDSLLRVLSDDPDRMFWQ